MARPPDPSTIVRDLARRPARVPRVSATDCPGCCRRRCHWRRRHASQRHIAGTLPCHGGTLTIMRAAHRRLRRSRAQGQPRSPRLTASGPGSPLPSRSHNRTPTAWPGSPARGLPWRCRTRLMSVRPVRPAPSHIESYRGAMGSGDLDIETAYDSAHRAGLDILLWQARTLAISTTGPFRSITVIPLARPATISQGNPPRAGPPASPPLAAEPGHRLLDPRHVQPVGLAEGSPDGRGRRRRADQLLQVRQGWKSPIAWPPASWTRVNSTRTRPRS
jgi:hypothetical protein